MAFDYVKDVADSVYDFILDDMDGMDEQIMDINDYVNNRERFILDFITNFGEEGDITGFVNHAYYNTTEQAIESLKGNHLLLHSALEARFYPDTKKAFDAIKDPDLCDVYIRCYVLPEAIGKAFDEVMQEKNKTNDKKKVEPER